MAFGRSLCAARRGAVEDGWAYRPRWQVYVQHGRWLLDAGQKHSLQCVNVARLAVELGRTQRRWEWVARAGWLSGRIRVRRSLLRPAPVPLTRPLLPAAPQP